MGSPSSATLTDRWVASGDAKASACVFVPPDAEVQRLLRWVPGLVALRSGSDGGAEEKKSSSSRPVANDAGGGDWVRLLRDGMVAPLPQLTFTNFEYQFYMLIVFHQSLLSRLGHGLFMPSTVFFLLAGLTEGVPAVGAMPAGALSLSAAMVLALWYSVVAAKIDAPLWGLVAVAEVGVLAAAAEQWPAAVAGSPWLWMLASTSLVALSHSTELMPPRANKTDAWMSVRDFLMGGPGVKGPMPRDPLAVPGRLAHVAGVAAWGAIDELIAAPRLAPYMLLWGMFGLGYKPELYAHLQQHATRAWASGNPALDYIGVGGGAVLRKEAAAEKR